MAWYVLFSISIFIRCLYVYGFLLDTPQTIGGSSSSSGQYVTLTKFMEATTLQEHEITIQRQITDKLRYDMDNNFAMLVSQMKDQFSLLEQKMVDERKLNKTQETLLLLQLKYKNLEQNHNELKIEHTALQQKYITLESKLNTLETKSSQTIDLERDLNLTNSIVYIQRQEISSIKNRTGEIGNQVSALVQLPSIKPLHEIDLLKQSLEALSKRTDTLTMKEQARSQDVLALYNMTIDTKSSFFGLRSNVNHDLSEMSANQSKTFAELKQNQSSEINRLERTLEKRQNNSMENIIQSVKDTELRVNESIELIQNQIKNSTEEVAMTAFVHDTDMYSRSIGAIVKFSDVQFSVGIHNLSQYKSSGKFMVEKRGLYLVSVTIEYDVNGAEFHIYVNGNVYTKNYKQQQSGWWLSSSATFVIDLQPGVTVWTQIGGTTTSVRGDQYSRFSIVKVK